MCSHHFPSDSGKVSFRHLVLNTALHQTFLHLIGPWKSNLSMGNVATMMTNTNELNIEGWSVACVRVKQQAPCICSSNWNSWKLGNATWMELWLQYTEGLRHVFAYRSESLLFFSCTHEPNCIVNENEVQRVPQMIPFLFIYGSFDYLIACLILKQLLLYNISNCLTLACTTTTTRGQYFFDTSNTKRRHLWTPSFHSLRVASQCQLNYFNLDCCHWALFASFNILPGENQ